VLREAIRVGELRDYLDGPTLVRVWSQLNLPRAVRAAWEARHPRLRHAR
jgi:predicted RNA-binding protein